MFEEDVAAATAVFFLRANHGVLNDLQLMKLLYLAEREGIKRYGAPVIGAQYWSMPHGPVLSEVYDMMRGEKINPLWYGHIEYVPFDGQTSNHCKLRKDTLNPEDYLSEAELSLLEEIWTTYKDQTKWNLVDLTHTFPEWDKNVEAPDSPVRATRLPVMDMLVKGFEMSKEEAMLTAQSIEYYQAF